MFLTCFKQALIRVSRFVSSRLHQERDRAHSLWRGLGVLQSSQIYFQRIRQRLIHLSLGNNADNCCSVRCRLACWWSWCKNTLTRNTTMPAPTLRGSDSTTTGTLLRRIVLYGMVYGQGEGASYQRARKQRQRRRSMSRIDRWANGPYEGEIARR